MRHPVSKPSAWTIRRSSDALMAGTLAPVGEAPMHSVERGDHAVGVHGDVAELEYVIDLYCLALQGLGLAEPEIGFAAAGQRVAIAWPAQAISQLKVSRNAACVIG